MISVVLATWVTNQLVVNGLVTGLVTGLLAMGLVLVHRSTRVINFAVGNLGLVGGALLPLLVIGYNAPFWAALAASILVGTVFGSVVELVVVRRLFRAPRVTLLIATVGVAQLAQAIIAAYPDIDVRGARYPVALAGEWTVAGVRITGPQLTILLVVPVLAGALGWLMNRTVFGKAIAASVDNTELARLSGVDPRIVSTIVWTIAGLLSTVSIVLLSGATGQVNGIENLGPLTLGRAMVAAVIAGMVSFPRAVAAGLGLGVAEALLRFNAFNPSAPTFVQDQSFIEVLVLVVVLIAIWWQSRTGDDADGFSFVPTVQPVPERLQRIWWVRHSSTIGVGLLLAVAVVLPLVVQRPSRHLLYATIICFAVCAVSVTVITGWAGQLSLSQMTFAGFGALAAAAFARGVEVEVLGVALSAPAVPFVLSLALGALVAAGVAALVGAGALRVRGLLLAVSTFVFAIAAQSYLFRRPILSGGNPDTVPFRRTDLFGIDLRDYRTYYFFCLAVLVIVLAVVARLRRSGVGRRIIAVRDNPDTAAAYTVRGVRTKLSAFALAGGIAGLGGALLAGLVDNVPLSERFFLVGDSLRLVGMVVIGGLGSTIGPVLGALWVIGLPSFFPANGLVPLFTSSIGLLVIVMYVPGGFVQLALALRGALIGFAERRLGPADPPAPRIAVAAVVRTGGSRAADTVDAAADALDTVGLTVRFGGLMAVNGVTIRVGAEEIVGLIGTNGSGKSTFMNAVGGYVRAEGVVNLFGREVGGLDAAGRARLGLGRTFQAATLFPELTLRETVMTALEARHPSPFLATAAFLPPSGRSERAKRSESEELIDFLGLGRYADRYVAELSTGTRRIVELAGLLALDARLLCLDEPTAGIAQREAEAFGPLLLRIRRELRAAMIVIEHDMPMVMSLSDRIYALEAGNVIAEGAPNDVRNDPKVIASYLGTDERAIVRSGAAVLVSDAGQRVEPS
jgi:ABC-type branched-subunit amino acid transport system ATPase component/ABC-type branched-subunit amino acid transport system permease subunit